MKNEPADPLASNRQTCFLSEATTKVPSDAEFVSLCLKGTHLPVKNADDVLIWVCKKALLSNPRRLFKAMHRLKPQWLKMSSSFMESPFTIASNCHLDFNCTGNTSLRRAALILKWIEWPRQDASITYTDTSGQVAAVASPAPLPGGHAGTQGPADGSVAAVAPQETQPGGHAGTQGPADGSVAVVAPSESPASGHAGTRDPTDGTVVAVAHTPAPAHPKENCGIVASVKAMPTTKRTTDEIGTYGIEDLVDPQSLDPRRLYGKRVMRLTIEGCNYDVLSWRKCFNEFLKHCFAYHQPDLTRFNWSSKWDGKAWPLVKRIYPGPTRYEVVLTEEKDAVKLVTTMGMIRRACKICPQDVRLVCAMKASKPSAPEPKTNLGGHAGTQGSVAGSVAVVAPLKLGSDRTAEAFAADLAANCPSGFDFRETSRRLSEARVGRRMTDAIAKALQSRMFERGDGLWLFPQMVMDDESRARLTARAAELLASEGAFAMDALRDEFADAIRNVPTGADFKRFFNAAVTPVVGGRVRGHEGWRVCFRAGTDEATGWAAIAGRVRGVLEAAEDAVSVTDVLAQLPHLDREVVLRVCRESIRDAVLFVADEIEYVKLLAAFYLPEDFGEAVSALVAEAEVAGGAVTVTTLTAALDARYGESFRVSFGLEDEETFRQVIALSFAGEEHVWSKEVFVAKESKSKANLAELFIRQRDGMFHEEEFFKFAEETRDLTNHDMLVRTFLNRRCIRMSKEWWISADGFDRMFGLTGEDFHQIGERLNEYVGQELFKSIDCMPESFYETLPALKCGEKTYPWNKYLLTSVGVHRIENAKVLNDGLSTYSCTAVVVPFAASGTDDLLAYVLKAFPVGYFDSAEAAFDFLKANNIRLAKKEKLLKTIGEVLGVA